LPEDKTQAGQAVLVVDDDSAVLRALARLIRADGFEALTFATPELLLRSVIPKNNACLLLDVHMPEMSGVELYKALCASGHGLPLIMMTGRNDAQTRHLLQEVNPVAVLLKPFDEGLLLDAIGRALHLSPRAD
jgi:two-component system response regulator FixJ